MNRLVQIIAAFLLICMTIPASAAILTDDVLSPRLPDFDEWCTNPRMPVQLLSLPYGYPTDLAASDLDGDGSVEVLVATQKVVSNSGEWISRLVLVDTSTSNDPSVEILATVEGIQTEWGLTALRQGFVSQLEVADVNGDELSDILVVVQTATDDPSVCSSYLLLVLGDGGGDFEILEIPLDLGFFLTGSILAVDLDQSGEIVVIVPDPRGGTLFILQEFDSGHFETTATILLQAQGFVPLQIVNDDIDNDGDFDLVLGGFELESSGVTQRSIRIAERIDKMEYSVGSSLKIGWLEPSVLEISIAVTDADGNGWLDILATARSDVETGISELTPSWSEAETIFMLSQTEPGLFFSQILSWEARGGPVSIEWSESDASSTRIVVHVPGSGCKLIEEDLGRNIGGTGRECIIPLSRSEAALLADLDGDSWLEIVLASRGEGVTTDVWVSSVSLSRAESE